FFFFFFFFSLQDRFYEASANAGSYGYLYKTLFNRRLSPLATLMGEPELDPTLVWTVSEDLYFPQSARALHGAGSRYLSRTIWKMVAAQSYGQAATPKFYQVKARIKAAIASRFDLSKDQPFQVYEFIYANDKADTYKDTGGKGNRRTQEIMDGIVDAMLAGYTRPAAERTTMLKDTIARRKEKFQELLKDLSSIGDDDLKKLSKEYKAAFTQNTGNAGNENLILDLARANYVFSDLEWLYLLTTNVEAAKRVFPLFIPEKHVQERWKWLLKEEKVKSIRNLAVAGTLPRIPTILEELLTETESIQQKLLGPSGIVPGSGEHKAFHQDLAKLLNLTALKAKLPDLKQRRDNLRREILKLADTLIKKNSPDNHDKRWPDLHYYPFSERSLRRLQKIYEQVAREKGTRKDARYYGEQIYVNIARMSKPGLLAFSHELDRCNALLPANDLINTQGLELSESILEDLKKADYLVKNDQDTTGQGVGVGKIRNDLDPLLWRLKRLRTAVENREVAAITKFWEELREAARNAKLDEALARFEAKVNVHDQPAVDQLKSAVRKVNAAYRLLFLPMRHRLGKSSSDLADCRKSMVLINQLNRARLSDPSPYLQALEGLLDSASTSAINSTDAQKVRDRAKDLVENLKTFMDERAKVNGKEEALAREIRDFNKTLLQLRTELRRKVWRYHSRLVAGKKAFTATHKQVNLPAKFDFISDLDRLKKEDWWLKYRSRKWVIHESDREKLKAAWLAFFMNAQSTSQLAWAQLQARLQEIMPAVSGGGTFIEFVEIVKKNP
ncbi:MAG: hypothetical protein D6820_00005, partial [Lentisphaerae bacterium]